MENTIFLESSQKAGATWASIEPEHQWVGFWVVLGLEEQIVKGLRVLAVVEVARVDIGRVLEVDDFRVVHFVSGLVCGDG